MRTTVSIPDHLLAQAKHVAAKRRTSLTSVVEASLRVYLAREREHEGREPTRELPVIASSKPVAGVDLDDSSALLEL